MRISVAMCTYNGDRFLEEQLRSIAAQTTPPTELVVCDDGSTDRTLQIVEEFSASAPFPVRLYANADNLGSTRNFEQAISFCRGDAVALCDQDDRWMPQKLAVLAEVLRARPAAGGAFSNAALMDRNGAPLEGDLWQRSEFTAEKQRAFVACQGDSWREAPYHLIRRDTVTGATLIFRSKYVEQILPLSKDWVHDGWIALILASIARLEAVPECLMTYRLHREQQVGLQQTPWHSHLHTKRDRAIESHLKLAARFSQIADRLSSLGADSGIVAYARSKAEFMGTRAEALRQTRGRRALPAVLRLREYRRFEKGIMSLLRDLTH